MTCHMILHDDVLGRILTILTQDNYYRTLEELPVILQLAVLQLTVLQLTKTSSSSPNYITPPPSLRESPVRQISLKDNLGNWVCTLHLEPLYLLLLVLYQSPPQYFNLLHQLPYHQWLTHTRQMDNKVLKHHQEVHYLVDSGHP